MLIFWLLLLRLIILETNEIIALLAFLITIDATLIRLSKKNEICCIYLNFLSSERVLIKISMVCVETLKKNYQKCQEFGIQKVTTNRTQWYFRQCVGGSMVTSTTQEAGTTWDATTRRHSSVKQWEVYMIHHKFCLLIIYICLAYCKSGYLRVGGIYTSYAISLKPRL